MLDPKVANTIMDFFSRAQVIWLPILRRLAQVHQRPTIRRTALAHKMLRSAMEAETHAQHIAES